MNRTDGMMAYFLEDYLELLTDERGEKIRQFHRHNLRLIDEAAGSSHNHQAWAGGYRDHLTLCLHTAKVMHGALTTRFMDAGQQLPEVPWDSVVVVLYFHDIEKMYKYSRADHPGFDKWDFLTNTLKYMWGVEFSDAELNALKYVHGEGGDYRKDRRVMNPLAGFCHAVDVTTARVFWNRDANGKVRVGSGEGTQEA